MTIWGEILANPYLGSFPAPHRAAGCHGDPPPHHHHHMDATKNQKHHHHTTTPPPPPHGCNATTKNTAKIHGKCLGDFCLKQCNDKARNGLLTFSRWSSRWKSIFVVTLAPKFWSTKIVTSFLYFHWTNNQISFNEAWKRNDAYSLDYFLFETIEPRRQEKKNGKWWIQSNQPSSASLLCTFNLQPNQTISFCFLFSCTLLLDNK